MIIHSQVFFLPGAPTKKKREEKSPPSRKVTFRNFHLFIAYRVAIMFIVLSRCVRIIWSLCNINIIQCFLPTYAYCMWNCFALNLSLSLSLVSFGSAHSKSSGDNCFRNLTRRTKNGIEMATKRRRRASNRESGKWKRKCDNVFCPLYLLFYFIIVTPSSINIYVDHIIFMFSLVCIRLAYG